jgi:hypothetical protein
MRTIQEFREWKLDNARNVLDRPGMYAPGSCIDSYMWALVTDLLWVDDRDDELKTLRDRFYPFGSLGLRAPVEWFQRLKFPPTDEIASLWAEVLADLRYVQVGASVDEERWNFINDRGRWESHDWTRSQIDGVLPRPTLVVGQHVLCYMPPDRGSWAFLDFDWQPGTTDPLLRDVRLPAGRPRDGLVITPHGNQYV